MNQADKRLLAAITHSCHVLPLDIQADIMFLLTKLKEARKERDLLVAGALEAAADVMDKLIQQGDQYGACMLKCPYREDHKQHIRALTTDDARKAQRKFAALERLEEAKWWRYLAIMGDDSYFAVEGQKRLQELEQQNAE